MKKPLLITATLCFFACNMISQNSSVPGFEFMKEATSIQKQTEPKTNYLQAEQSSCLLITKGWGMISEEHF